MMASLKVILVVAFLDLSTIHAFHVPSPRMSTTTVRRTLDTSFTSSQPLHMMIDPSSIMDTATSATNAATAFMGIDSTSLLTSFVDQGTNLAGIFFQASLLPYLLFLYFLSYRANRISPWSNFGFQYVLLFVMSTIPSGILAKSIYGTTLANVDWLHGGAETLLTLANIFIVLGFKENMTTYNTTPVGKFRNYAFGLTALFAALCAAGPSLLGFDVHSAFAFGLGDLSSDFVLSNLNWISHSEPENALSIPTWAIHFSSVFEYLFAMNLVWQYATVTENPKWKGLTWGMLPLHASGVCACTFHFFYNAPSLQFLVTSQAGLTLLGNITCFIAAFRIAQSNGWTIQELNPFSNSPTSPQGLVADGLAMKPLVLQQQQGSSAIGMRDDGGMAQRARELGLPLVGLTLVSSYAVKYGELGLDLPFYPNAAPYALAMILLIPGLTAFSFYTKSKQEESLLLGDGGNTEPAFRFPKFGGNNDESDENKKGGLSFADVKKYGVAGTVAYVLTELAFWIVAFPVAATALYQSTGHWPDVFNDNTDRAAVLAFIFAGANIARLAVPLRLGAALALAPWVDENIINRNSNNGADGNEEESAFTVPK